MILQGDALSRLALLAPESVDCCITSPPYWGLRDYGMAGQVGVERTPAEYVTRLVEIFREVRRVLRSAGTLWLNLGDSHSHGGHGARDPEKWPKQSRNDHHPTHGKTETGLSPKQLVGIPWLVAFALQADGWYLRSDIIWHKPNPMPESVKDRPTRAHEYIFLLSKSARYYYDHLAAQEPAVNPKFWKYTDNGKDKQRGHSRRHAGFNGRYAARLASAGCPTSRNRRSVWTVAPAPYRGAHFATYPPALIEPCVLAGCPGGGLVLDPFAGAGSTGIACLQHGRNFLGIELNPDYVAMARARLESFSRTLLLPQTHQSTADEGFHISGQKHPL